MAFEAEMITPDQEVISIGETHQGTETTLVVKLSHARNFYDLEIREIIAKSHFLKEVKKTSFWEGVSESEYRRHLRESPSRWE